MKGVPSSNAENDALQTRFIRQKDPSYLESAFLRTLTLSCPSRTDLNSTESFYAPYSSFSD